MKDGPVLLLGHGGMLGRAWKQLLDEQGVDYSCPSREELDLAQPQSIRRVLTPQFSLVINAAGYTNVDGCETDEAQATRINGEAVGHLARRCAELGAVLVHYSTDYVFDGRGSQPYRTDAPLAPLGAYGRGKAVGESLLQNSGCDYLLVRTSWLYASWGQNFVRTILRLASQRPTLRVVDDQRGRPTCAPQLAENCWRLLGLAARGTYHLSDGESCTWYELAQAVVELAGLDCQVEPCTTEEFPRPAPRPAYSVLDLSAAEAELGPLPPWRENLQATLDELVSAVVQRA